MNYYRRIADTAQFEPKRFTIDFSEFKIKNTLDLGSKSHFYVPILSKNNKLFYSFEYDYYDSFGSDRHKTGPNLQ